jgi:hypothetical protein
MNTICATIPQASCSSGVAGPSGTPQRRAIISTGRLSCCVSRDPPIATDATTAWRALYCQERLAERGAAMRRESFKDALLRAGYEAITATPHRASDTTQSTAIPVRLEQVQRAPRRGRDRAACRQRRRLLRQRSRRRWLACSRPRASGDAGRGEASKPSSSQPSSGSTGSTTGGSSSRSETCLWPSESVLLCNSLATRHGGVTQAKQPPANPARITPAIIEADAHALAEFNRDSESDEDAAKRVYRTMSEIAACRNRA